MIVVAGEALMDVLAEPDDRLVALPGGSVFNVARALGWLGADCLYLGSLSDDRFGSELRERLTETGARLAVPDPVAAPTTLALAELDDSGAARYRFYDVGTSAARLEPRMVPPGLLSGADALLVGGIVLGLEPVASTLVSLAAGAPEELTVMCDPNCRPSAIHDREHHRRTIDALLRRVDVVKASVEDLALLSDDRSPPLEAARALIERGPAAVIVTDGPRPVSVLTAERVDQVPVPDVEVVDTIGAGDAFVAGLLAWWAEHRARREAAADHETLIAATRAAVEVSARACAVRGAGLAPA
ncbi:MAG TPA: PfkB family carbohydrate kinase [Solirubrobacteraceae bacterium]|nr:PfkB family carbohydrate kinase [Solirubrobacteraceae bacterium]